MEMIIKAHQGSNGMNVKFRNTEMVAIRIPASALTPLQKDTETGRETDYAPTMYVHPQVLALVVIQSFVLSM
jgi:hypothetical protein